SRWKHRDERPRGRQIVGSGRVRTPLGEQLVVGRGEDAAPERLLEQSARLANLGGIGGGKQWAGIRLQRRPRAPIRDKALNLEPIAVDPCPKPVRLCLEQLLPQVGSQAV